MPIYEYECTECRLRFERRQSFSDEPIKVCPDCSGATRKVMQPVGIVFKGSGWYITDNRGSTPAAESTPPAASDSKTESKPETKAEAKTEAKSAAAEVGKAPAAPAAPAAKA
jgi:putative FmdB family regulatory protein